MSKKETKIIDYWLYNCKWPGSLTPRGQENVLFITTNTPNLLSTSRDSYLRKKSILVCLEEPLLVVEASEISSLS